jgi:hypothetical protein
MPGPSAEELVDFILAALARDASDA